MRGLRGEDSAFESSRIFFDGPCGSQYSSCGWNILAGHLYGAHKILPDGRCEEVCESLFNIGGLTTTGGYQCGTCAERCLESTYQKFTTRTELIAAIQDYYADDSPGSLVAQTYGHPIGSWCTGAVTDFSFLFQTTPMFNQDISAWDTSNADDFSGIFLGAIAFDQDLNTWSTSKVTRMDFAFERAHSFNGKIDEWDTSNVDNMVRRMERFWKGGWKDVSHTASTMFCRRVCSFRLRRKFLEFVPFLMTL